MEDLLKSRDASKDVLKGVDVPKGMYEEVEDLCRRPAPNRENGLYQALAQQDRGDAQEERLAESFSNDQHRNH